MSKQKEKIELVSENLSSNSISSFGEIAVMQSLKRKQKGVRENNPAPLNCENSRGQ